MAHTPGPWTTLPEECDKPYIRVRGTVLGGRFKIANVLTPVYEGVHQREAVETRANARLIAAAPDLLEALQSIAECCEEDQTARDYASRQTEIRGIARAAIAKATGEQQ